jgi:hypothetical protein
MDTPCRDTKAVPELSTHRAFVVHFYGERDLDERETSLRGRVEHVVSGEGSEFESMGDLLTFVRRVLRTVLAAALVLLIGHGGATSDARAAQSTTIESELLKAGVDASRFDAALIVGWNELAHDIAFAEDQFRTFKGQRALAMMHLAMHDALNSIRPVYERYAYAGPRVIAHPVTAAAYAAHDVLMSQYPQQQPKLAAELSTWIGELPDGPITSRGRRVGQAAAAAILAKRANDGWDFSGTYEFVAGPGQYQTTPPWDGFVVQPGFRLAKPFVAASPRQLRPPPPLKSTAYARAFQEVKDTGAVNSTTRTHDQTAYAIWWMEFAEGSVNRVARQLATARRSDLWTAARLFAHVGVALYDSYIAVWDGKYEFNHWRPYTAVRAADVDENPRTLPDPNWEPLRPTPPFPEYPSAHAAGCAASFSILTRAFGRDFPFTMETTSAPAGMPTRSFASFDVAAQECADSRVRLGWHFRYATDGGLDLGRSIASFVLRHSLQDVSRPDDDRK